jgi:hypothetical protein
MSNHNQHQQHTRNRKYGNNRNNRNNEYRNNNFKNDKNQNHYRNKSNKRDKSDINITLIDKLMDISFCDKKCSNVNDNETKGHIIEYLDSMYDIQIFNKQYTNLNPNMLRNITHHQHLLSVLTNGNPYILFLTKIDGINCCLYIDTKLKNGFTFPKIHCVKYKFNDELFNDTVLSGELVRDCAKNWFFLINNILIYKGKNMMKENVISRFFLINKIILEEYTHDPSIEVCHFQIKRLFKYSEISLLLEQFIPNLSYPAKGLIFHTFNSNYNDYMYIFNNRVNYINNFDDIDIKISNDRPELISKKENSEQYILDDFVTNTGSDIGISNTNDIVYDNHHKEQNIFKLLKTDITDVYYLYCYDKDKNLTKIDYALIPSLTKSRYIKSIFAKENNPPHLLFKCGYSEIFEKWTPIEYQNSYTDNDIFVSN